MSFRRLRRLPVVDRHGRLVGIVCRSDVLSVFSRPDEEIRREITQDVILDGFFTDPARAWSPSVTDSPIRLPPGPAHDHDADAHNGRHGFLGTGRVNNPAG